jgi:hypothetical protein
MSQSDISRVIHNEMQSPNRNKYHVAGVLAKFIQTHPEFDSQQFEIFAQNQPRILKYVVARESRLALLGFKAAGAIQKVGHRLGATRLAPVTIWRTVKVGGNHEQA